MGKQSHGQTVAWSIADYLSSMEQNVVALIAEKNMPVVKDAPKQEAKEDAGPGASPGQSNKT